jgi:hypothetical protein
MSKSDTFTTRVVRRATYLVLLVLTFVLAPTPKDGVSTHTTLLLSNVAHADAPTGSAGVDPAGSGGGCASGSSGADSCGSASGGADACG